MRSTTKQLNAIARTAERFADRLLNKNRVMGGGEPPTGGGVYLIVRDGKVIYVGTTNNLRKRIKRQHVSAAKTGRSSVFRRKVHERRGIPYGETMKKWAESCSFASDEIADADMRELVEALLVCYLKQEGEPLLNS